MSNYCCCKEASATAATAVIKKVPGSYHTSLKISGSVLSSRFVGWHHHWPIFQRNAPFLLLIRRQVRFMYPTGYVSTKVKKGNPTIGRIAKPISSNLNYTFFEFSKVYDSRRFLYFDSVRKRQCRCYFRGIIPSNRLLSLTASIFRKFLRLKDLRKIRESTSCVSES